MQFHVSYRFSPFDLFIWVSVVLRLKVLVFVVKFCKSNSSMLYLAMDGDANPNCAVVRPFLKAKRLRVWSL
jgi:hypothetical protein